MSKERGRLLLTIASLAKYFKSPLEFFLNQDINEIDEWIQVMNEMVKQEEEAIKKAQKGAK